MEFSQNERNQLVPEVLTVRIESNDFDVLCNSKQIAVPAEGDSDTCVFFVSAKYPGRLRLLVEVLHERVIVASHLLRTTAAELIPTNETVPYIVAVLPLTVYARQTRQIAGEFMRMFNSPLPSKPAAGDWEPNAAVAPGPQFPQVPFPPPAPAAPIPEPKKVGEFTQMFGRHDAPPEPDASPAFSMGARVRSVPR